MLNGIGAVPAYANPSANGTGTPPSSSGSTAALQGEIQGDQVQLADWTSCVSANTPTGKAEIAAISAKISGAKERIARIEAAKANPRAAASASSPAASAAAAAASAAAKAAAHSSQSVAASQAGSKGDTTARLVDVWV